MRLLAAASCALALRNPFRARLAAPHSPGAHAPRPQHPRRCRCRAPRLALLAGATPIASRARLTRCLLCATPPRSRPRNVDEVACQEEVVSALRKSIQTGNVRA